MSLFYQNGGLSLLSLITVILFVTFSNIPCLAIPTYQPGYYYNAGPDDQADYTYKNPENLRGSKMDICGPDPQSSCIRPEIIKSKVTIEREAGRPELPRKMMNILSAARLALAFPIDQGSDNEDRF